MWLCLWMVFGVGSFGSGRGRCRMRRGTAQVSMLVFCLVFLFVEVVGDRILRLSTGTSVREGRQAGIIDERQAYFCFKRRCDPTGPGALAVARVWSSE